jgi:hypothetical protein
MMAVGAVHAEKSRLADGDFAFVSRDGMNWWLILLGTPEKHGLFHTDWSGLVLGPAGYAFYFVAYRELGGSNSPPMAATTYHFHSSSVAKKNNWHGKAVDLVSIDRNCEVFYRWQQNQDGLTKKIKIKGVESRVIFPNMTLILRFALHEQ